MINLTLRQLRYLDALARHGRFGRAAEACAVSQPALSMQIKELEEAVGVALFERAAKQVQLTPFGEEFVRRSQSILRAVGELEDLAHSARGGLGGRLRLGIIPTIAPYLLPAILERLRRDFGDLVVDVRESITLRLTDELTDGRLDAAIAALPIGEPGLEEIELFCEPFVLIRPVSAATEKVPALAELGQARLLLLEEGHCFREQALAFCGLRSSGEWGGLDGSSLSTLVQLVAAGLGITLLPEMAVPVETRSAPISVHRFAAPEPSRTIGMVWRRTSPLRRALVQIAECVREAALSQTEAAAAHSAAGR